MFTTFGEHARLDIDKANASKREADKEAITEYLRGHREDPMVTYEEDAENILRLLGR